MIPTRGLWDSESRELSALVERPYQKDIGNDNHSEVFLKLDNKIDNYGGPRMMDMRFYTWLYRKWKMGSWVGYPSDETLVARPCNSMWRSMKSKWKYSEG